MKRKTGGGGGGCRPHMCNFTVQRPTSFPPVPPQDWIYHMFTQVGSEEGGSGRGLVRSGKEGERYQGVDRSQQRHLDYTIYLILLFPVQVYIYIFIILPSSILPFSSHHSFSSHSHISISLSFSFPSPCSSIPTEPASQSQTHHSFLSFSTTTKIKGTQLAYPSTSHPTQK